MGSRDFRYVRSDGSWPVLTVGGDLDAYQRCFQEFVGAWKRAEDIDAAAAPAGEPTSIAAQVQAAYLRGCRSRRPARLISSN